MSERVEAVKRRLWDEIDRRRDELARLCAEGLTVPAVQDAVVAFLSGRSVGSLRLRADPPRFPTLAAALAPAPPSR